MKNENKHRSLDDTDTTLQKCEGCEFYRTKLLHNAIEAAMISNLDALRSALDELEDKSLIEDIRLFSKPTPLYHLSLYNQMIWDTKFWGWDDREGSEIIKWMERRTAEVIEFWKSYYGVDKLAKPDYKAYAGVEYLAYNDTDEDILDCKREDLVRNGCRELDIELYLASHRFEYAKAEELLQQGASPDADLCTDPENEFPSDWAYHHISSEESWLIDNLWKVFKDAFYGNEPKIEWWCYDHLLGLAAYVKMDKLFEKYRHIWDKE